MLLTTSRLWNKKNIIRDVYKQLHRLKEDQKNNFKYLEKIDIDITLGFQHGEIELEKNKEIMLDY